MCNHSGAERIYRCVGATTLRNKSAPCRYTEKADRETGFIWNDETGLGRDELLAAWQDISTEGTRRDHAMPGSPRHHPISAVS